MSGFTVRLSDNWADDGWTMVPRNILRDGRLSWKARGLVAFLASHDAGFKINRQFLLNAAKDGESALESGLRELRELGYLTVTRPRDERGRVQDHAEYTLHRFPCTPETGDQDSCTPKTPAQENPGVGKSGTKREKSKRETTGKVAPADASAPDAPSAQAEEEAGALPGMPAAPPKPLSGGDVTKAFVDAYVAAKRRQPPAPTIGKVGAAAKRLINGGADPAVVLRAAQAMAATQWSNLEAQYERELAQAATAPPATLDDARERAKAWVNDAWQHGKVGEVARITGLSWSFPAIPDDIDADRDRREAFVLADKRKWITTHRDAILRAYLNRTGGTK